MYRFLVSLPDLRFFISVESTFLKVIKKPINIFDTLFLIKTTFIGFVFPSKRDFVEGFDFLEAFRVEVYGLEVNGLEMYTAFICMSSF